MKNLFIKWYDDIDVDIRNMFLHTFSTFFDILTLVTWQHWYRIASIWIVKWTRLRKHNIETIKVKLKLNQNKNNKTHKKKNVNRCVKFIEKFIFLFVYRMEISNRFRWQRAWTTHQNYLCLFNSPCFVMLNCIRFFFCLFANLFSRNIYDKYVYCV